MASFETHVRAGTAAHFALTTVSVVSLVFGGSPLVIVATTGSLPLTIAGAIFPDIDHHASRPYRLAKRWVPRISVAGIGLVLATEIAYLRRLVELFVVGPRAQFYVGCLYMVLLWLVRRGVSRVIPLCRPPHRTVTHSVSTGMMVSGFVAGCGVVLMRTIAPTQPVIFGGVWGLCFGAGFLSHLYCDGLVTWEALLLR